MYLIKYLLDYLILSYLQTSKASVKKCVVVVVVVVQSMHEQIIVVKDENNIK